MRFSPRHLRRKSSFCALQRRRYRIFLRICAMQHPSLLCAPGWATTPRSHSLLFTLARTTLNGCCLLSLLAGQRPAGKPGRWARARRNPPERSRRASLSRGGGAKRKLALKRAPCGGGARNKRKDSQRCEPVSKTVRPAFFHQHSHRLPELARKQVARNSFIISGNKKSEVKNLSLEFGITLMINALLATCFKLS